jgi:alkylation response protein AidB-like acyl-CoA dehydrogenase
MVKALQSASGPRSATAAGSDSLLERARRLAPMFRANGEANEQLRRLTDETVAALTESRLFGLWTPGSLGGSELWPLDAIEVIETVSEADASTGWVMFAAALAIATGSVYLHESAVKQLFSGGRLPVIAGQGIPNGKAIAVKDGFRLSGAWSYGSGVKHSNYLHTGAVVYENGAPRTDAHGNPEMRIFVLPIEKAVFGDNWDVLGLRATGSIDYTIDDVFVPNEFTHVAHTTDPLRGGPLFFLGISGFATLGHSAFALGLGRRILDELATIAQTKTGVTGTPRESESFLESYAKAEASLRAARAFVIESWGSLQENLQRGERPTTRQFTLVRLALNNATWSVGDIANFAYRAAGGIALRASAIQRCFRDMYAATQHVTSSAPILRDCGRELAGLVKDKSWGFIGLIDAH